MKIAVKTVFFPANRALWNAGERDGERKKKGGSFHESTGPANLIGRR